MILTFVLGALIVLAAFFGEQAVVRTRNLRSLQMQAVASQANLNRINLLLNDSIEYSKTHPDLKPIIEPYITKPAAR